ncbi:MAG: hypothetical protein ICV63_12530 [Coleofasciculus sp. Co-bin14]|nr:hypothetical protein [Coleofasciculus sp. Co-bin14]
MRSPCFYESIQKQRSHIRDFVGNKWIEWGICQVFFSGCDRTHEPQFFNFWVAINSASFVIGRGGKVVISSM